MASSSWSSSWASAFRKYSIVSPEFLSTTAQVTAQVTAHVIKVLNAAAGEPRPREALQAAAKMRHREHFRKAYVEPLVKAGWLEYTIPDKPTSRLQRYRLTKKGRAWLAGRMP